MGVIQFLPPEEARKIAAGEVIDRPAALVREFIDNAVDSGGTVIETSIEGGGIKRVEVSDDGCGIARDDLEIAWKTHATSKIYALDDLNTVKTLGFRGEALAAASAVARLEILTSTGSTEGWRLLVVPEGKDAVIEAARRIRGTSVRAMGLFDMMPARKRFLKREGSEAMLCRQIFIEKALAFYERSFRFVQDHKIKLFFPVANNFKERFAQAIIQNETVFPFLHEIHVSGEGFSVAIVIGGPEIYRENRRSQFIFANGRRIADYSLQQAMEYGSQGVFPNGTHPVGAVFLDIDPHLADFNVHPAKLEAKFIPHNAIHHTISTTLRVFFHNLLVSKAMGRDAVKSKSEDAVLEIDGLTMDEPPSAGASVFCDASQLRRYDYLERQSVSDEIHTAQEARRAAADLPDAVRYLGTVFSLFLLVEKDGRLYAIDQHAAHERVLYNKFVSKPILKQELLVPIPFTTDNSGDDEFLSGRRVQLEKLGIVITGGNGSWRIEALPALWRLGDIETVKAILGLKDAGEDIAERWAATIACHGAIRDGERLDDESAARLAAETFELQRQRCPHGRPVITEIKKEDLLKAVRRL